MGPGLPQGFPQCPKKRPRPVNNWPSSLISSCARPGLFSNKDYQGGHKVELLEDALTDTPLMLPMEYCNLESMHCPTIA